MELKPGYKMTEVGIIPEEWEVKCLGELGNVVRGGSPRPAGDPRFFNGSYIPWLTVGSLTSIPTYQLFVTETAERLTREGAKRSRTLQSGMLVIVNSGARTLGVAKLLAIACCANDGIAALTNQAAGNKHFICYYLNTQIKRLREVVAAGNDQLNLNTTRIASIAVPYPPVPEQQAIAVALMDVDELIGSLDRLIAKKLDLKQAAMQQLLTGQTRLPGFSGEWQETTLNEVGYWKGGMTPSMRNPAYWENGTIPWASSGDVKVIRLTETAVKITGLAIKHGTTTLLPSNSILVVTRSGILRKCLPVALNPFPIAINQDIKALLPHDWVDANFMLHWLIGNGTQILSRCMKSGTTVESIELSWLKAYKIRLPRKDEQTAIAEVLSDVDAEIAALENRRNKTRLLKQGMMQELLTGRTRLV